MKSTINLDELRSEIDLIDSEMHELLLKRASVVSRIESAKSLTANMSAYRPAREARMMRLLVSRHHGPFPYAAAEHIWREMIGNFTRMQSPYTIHIGSKAWEFRDLAHFYFGVMTPLQVCDDSADAMRALSERTLDMAIIPLQDTGQDVWWQKCAVQNGAMRVVARVPFLYAEKALPNAFIVAHVPLEPTGDDKTLYAITGTPEQGADVLAAQIEGGKPISARIVGETHHVLAVSSGFYVEETVKNSNITCIGAYAAPHHVIV